MRSVNYGGLCCKKEKKTSGRLAEFGFSVSDLVAVNGMPTVYTTDRYGEYEEPCAYIGLRANPKSDGTYDAARCSILYVSECLSFGH